MPEYLNESLTNTQNKAVTENFQFTALFFYKKLFGLSLKNIPIQELKN
jgi:hypothetical protein